MNDSEGSFELMLMAGRLFGSKTGLDGPGCVAFRDGRIAACGPEIRGVSQQRLDFPDCVLLPGLIDLHAHPAGGGSRYGIDPDRYMLPDGVTTVLSQGDAGAANWDDYLENTILGSDTRVRLALNLSRAGESNPQRCFESNEDVDIKACAKVARAGGEHIWGISVNTGKGSCGDLDPRWVMNCGLEVAERTGKPMLVGLRRASDWSIEEQLVLLRRGDVVTYCFSPGDEGLVAEGQVRPCVWRARERGILFDLGHGMASFAFSVAETAIAEGFLPDTISTDKYKRHIGPRPMHSLPLAMSKLVAAGMSSDAVLKRVTHRAAEVLGLEEEVGALVQGQCADIAVLRWNDEPVPLFDTRDDERTGGYWETVLTVRAGNPIEPAS